MNVLYLFLVLIHTLKDLDNGAGSKSVLSKDDLSGGTQKPLGGKINVSNFNETIT